MEVGESGEVGVAVPGLVVVVSRDQKESVTILLLQEEDCIVLEIESDISHVTLNHVLLVVLTLDRSNVEHSMVSITISVIYLLMSIGLLNIQI